MEELRIDASIENVDRLISILDERLEEVDCPLKAQMQLDVAMEEIFGNICNYAYGDTLGQVLIRICVTPDLAEVVFIDRGLPFNPLEKEEADVIEVAKSNQLGGLGILMVKQSMDEVSYERKDNSNYLTIRKVLV